MVKVIELLLPDLDDPMFSEPPTPYTPHAGRRAPLTDEERAKLQALERDVGRPLTEDERAKALGKA